MDKQVGYSGNRRSKEASIPPGKTDNDANEMLIFLGNRILQALPPLSGLAGNEDKLRSFKQQADDPPSYLEKSLKRLWNQ